MAERTITTRVKLSGADKYKQEMSKVSGSVQQAASWTDTLKGILASDIIKKGFTAIVNGVKDSINASIEFEDALAGVAKTTTMSDTMINHFGEELMKLSERIPTSATELAGLAEAAGQLGIADEDIIEFIEVMAALGVSTNLTADEAATSLAKIANIFQTDAKYYENMGSTIVDLGNNFATTEKDITEMSLAMAGYAHTSGLSEAATFGLSAALSSVGIEAEAGSSSVGNIMSDISRSVALGGSELQQYASIAGMTADQFKTAWTQDAGNTFVSFIEGIQKAGAAGQSALLILDNLGITQIRETKAMLGLVGSGDLLANTMETANTAWAENVALQNEAEKKYATTASQIAMLENQIQNAKTGIGDAMSGITEWGVGAARSAMDALNELVNRETSFTEASQKAEETYAETMKGIQDTEYVAIGAVSALANMDSASGEYASTLEHLSNIFPELRKYIDEETGSLTVSTDELSTYVGEIANARRETAELTKLKNQYDAYTIANATYTEASAKLAELEEQARFLQEQDNIFNNMDAGDLTQADWEEWNQITGMLWDVNQNIDLYREKVRDAGIELEGQEGIVDAYTEALQAQAEAMGISIETQDEWNAETKNAVTNMALLTAAADGLQTAYAEAYSNIKGNLDSVVHGFDYLWSDNEAQSYSTGGMLDQLQEQLDFVNNYQENLQKFKDMGFTDEDIFNLGLTDGSKESFRVLSGLVDGTVEDAQAILDKYQEIQTGKEELAASLAASEVGLESETEQIVTAASQMVTDINQNSEAYQAGMDTIQGYIDGLNALLPTLNYTGSVIRSVMDFGGGSGPRGEGRRDGSHANGLGYVPFDGYIAELHRGEMVLTALEARAYRAERSAGAGLRYEYAGNTSTTNNNAYNSSINISGVSVRSDADIERLAEAIARRNKRINAGYGG